MFLSITESLGLSVTLREGEPQVGEDCKGEAAGDLAQGSRDRERLNNRTMAV